MADKKVSIAAGHAGFGVTPGKRGPDGKVEWTWNNAVVLAAIAHLKNFKGITVVRVDDPSGRTDVSLNTRVARANAANSDLHIDVHHNALMGKWFDGPGGVETFVMQGTSANAQAMKAAKEIHPRVVKAMGLRDRGLKQANFQILRTTKMPAVLTEGGFMDSRVDRKAMDDPAKIKAQGVAIAEGAAAYLNLTINAPVQASKPVESRSYLLNGNTGEKVRTLQTGLKQAGHKLDVDGIFGDGTEKAVRAFQLGNNLEDDGVWGKASQAKLNAILANLNKKPVVKPAAPTKPKEESAVEKTNQPSKWAEATIKEAVKIGVTDGSNLHDPITRQEAIVLAMRAAGLAPKLK